MTDHKYFYESQIKNRILQFMAVFCGLEVQTSFNPTTDTPNMSSVPVRFGHADRVVSSLLAHNTQNAPIQLPMMSVYLDDINISPSRMVGQTTERRQVHIPEGGIFPDDLRVIHQARPVPYDMTFSVSIFASNHDQMFQILEQLLPLFTPSLQIQTSDELFDWTKITSLTLLEVQNTGNFGNIGQNQRLVQYTLKFLMPAYLHLPDLIRVDYIKRVLLRIGAINTNSLTDLEILEDLDGQHIPYEEIFNERDDTTHF